MENGTRNKRRAHHAETNSGTDIVTSDKRMHTRLAVLFPVTPYHFFIVSYPLLVLLYPESYIQFDTEYLVILYIYYYI